MFSIRHLDVIRFGRTVISNLSLAAPAPGSLALIGPGGAGKSSLLLAVTGAHDDTGSLRLSGEIRLGDIDTHALGDELGWYPQWNHRPNAVASAAHAIGLSRDQRRALSRQRLESLAAFVSVRRRLYVLDEPTALLDDHDAEQARALMHALAANAFVLLATHNRIDCAALNGHMAIIADGEICEFGLTRDMLVRPKTEEGIRYMTTGYVTRPVRMSQPGASEGIWWVVPGLLCGLSRPGLVACHERQFELMAAQGVRHIVCLEETLPTTPSCAQFGIALHHLPVPDMAAPSFEQAVAFCRLAERAITNNEGVAFHCKGGLGRTGTSIAAVLIWLGDAAGVAIGKVRSVQHLAIQSASQLDFLSSFADRLRDGSFPAANSH